MVRPERRTKGDLIAAAAIVAVVIVVIGLFWWRSSERATISRPSAQPAPATTAATAVPSALQQRWTATSTRTVAPVALGGVVVTGDGRTVAGLDPQSGEQLWSYARDAELCAVSYVYDLAVAVYPDQRGCGQVSGLKAATGQRGPTRTSYADKVVVVTSDGSAVLSAGATRLELWRSDLIRMLSYGEIDAPVKPVNTKLGTGCALMSAAGSESGVGVLEACPGKQDLRLTLLKPAKEEDEPDTKHVELLGVAIDAEARVLASATTTTAVYLPTPDPRVVVYDETGTTVSETPLPGPPVLSGAAPAVTRAGDMITWWTGNSVLVFDSKLGYRYTVEGTGAQAPLGPATMMTGRLLVPVTDGLAVCDPADGALERVIPLAHPSGTGAVMPAVSGPMVIEQRGAELAAFGPAAG
ncbi:MAG: PQQ-binding-like beta-propeller repeat protein [Mycobacterium sp.]